MPDFDGGSAVRRSSRGGGEKGPAMPLKADIDPPPTPWPFAPALALLTVVFFISLQFILPVTHVRHPADPLRNWIPVEELKTVTQNKIASEASDTGSSLEGAEGTLIVVMAKETDLRPVFVVLNSTVTNTKEPEKLHFCIIVPSILAKSEALKLRAVFSNLKVDTVRDEFVVERLKASNGPAATIYENRLKELDLVPFYLPKIFPNYERFIYMESDAVIQADILELSQIDMEGSPIAGVEDCSQNFEMFFSMDLLEAARLSAANDKPQVPVEQYDPKRCLLDKGMLVLDCKLWNQKNITDAVHWWIDMYHKTGESLYSNGHLELPVYLALYQYWTLLDGSWSVREPLTWSKASSAKLVHFDKQHKPWHQTKPTNFEKDTAGLWWKYLSPSVNAMFNTQ